MERISSVQTPADEERAGEEEEEEVSGIILR